MMEKNTIFNGLKLNIRLRDDADESVFAEIFDWREYRAADNVIKTAKNVILDIGAHIGLFNLYCRALNPKIKIIALEPEINNFKLLKKHLQKNNLTQIKTINAALANKSEIRNLAIALDNHNHRLTAPNEGALSDRPTIPVPSLNLKDLCYKEQIDAIDLLKMDIEGGEYEIIDSLDQEIISKIKNIILEYHDLDKEKNYKTLDKKLRQLGFGIQRFPSHFDKNLGFILANNKSTLIKGV